MACENDGSVDHLPELNQLMDDTLLKVPNDGMDSLQRMSSQYEIALNLSEKVIKRQFILLTTLWR